MNLFSLLCQYLLPHRLLAQLIAKIADTRIKIVKNLIIRAYCGFYNVDLKDALEQNLLNYKTFNEFFTRALKPEARPFADDNDGKTIISPVDGMVYQSGTVNNSTLITAKGKGFTLEQLLSNQKEADLFLNASFVVLYLAPSDYHRIHAPIDCRLKSMRYIPGSFFSVKPSVVENIPEVFAKNERVVIFFETKLGPMIMVLVGAAIVGSIETTWHGRVISEGKVQIQEWDYGSQVMSFSCGMELGRFKLGSTVIVLFPEKTILWNETLKNNPVKMGQQIGTKLNLETK